MVLCVYVCSIKRKRKKKDFSQIRKHFSPKKKFIEKYSNSHTGDGGGDGDDDDCCRDSDDVDGRPKKSVLVLELSRSFDDGSVDERITALLMKLLIRRQMNKINLIITDTNDRIQPTDKTHMRLSFVRND